MTSWITRLFLLIVLGSAHAADPVIVGTVVSQSGGQAELAADYRKALLLWQDELNASGGLLGRRVELRILDDHSEAPRSAKLYEQLIGEERADLLIGPFGSAATLIAASVAERSSRVMVNGAGPSRAIHRRSPRFVFQTTVPYTAYGERAVALARDQGMRSIFLAARDDAASREMADAAHLAAGALGIAVNMPEFYAGSADDFSAQVLQARAAQAEAWIAFGDARDAAQMVRTFKRLEYAPRLFFARGAADAKFIALVGQDAEFSVSASAYDARLAANGAAFAKAFTAKWSSLPGTAAAEGYVAGRVLAAAVARAGTLQQEKLRAALAALEMETLLGGYKVNPATGEQIGAKPVLFQIVNGRPQAVAPGGRLLPYRAWNERERIKR